MLTISGNNQYTAPYQQKKAEKKIGFGDVHVSIKNQQRDNINMGTEFANAADTIIELRKRTGIDLKGENSYLGEKMRAGKFLNWIAVLPKMQSEQLDAKENVYTLAKKVPQPGGWPGQIKDLVIVGIGGSKHTTEALLDLVNPPGRKNVNVHFYSAADNESFDRLKQKLNPKKTLVLVVSKSGTTMETKTGYEKLRAFIEPVMKGETKNRFIAVTDTKHKGYNPDKPNDGSELRLHVKEGRIAHSLLVHDDVGGRFSIFDDATLFTLAYLGMPIQDMKDMLDSSQKAQKKFLDTSMHKNTAMQLAIFNESSRKQGKQIHGIEMFGDAFNGTALWKKQMDNESIKGQPYTDTNIGPAFLHYNAESDLAKTNTNSFYTFINVKPQENDKTHEHIMEGVVTAYSKKHPVAHVTMDSLSAKDIGEFIELQQFATLYTGMLGRKGRDEKEIPLDKPMPEVVQPNVEIYKDEVKLAAAKKS